MYYYCQFFEKKQEKNERQKNNIILFGAPGNGKIQIINTLINYICDNRKQEARGIYYLMNIAAKDFDEIKDFNYFTF